MLRARYGLAEAGDSATSWSARRARGGSSGSRDTAGNSCPLPDQEAFAQIYRFRQTIEPAAILEPTFRIIISVLRGGAFRSASLEHDIETLPGERFLKAAQYSQ